MAELPPEAELQEYWDDILKSPVQLLTAEWKQHIGTNGQYANRHPIDRPYMVKWAKDIGRRGACGAWWDFGKHEILVSVRHHCIYGWTETKAALRHEAAHALEYWLHGATKNSTRRFEYYLEYMGGARHASSLR